MGRRPALYSDLKHWGVIEADTLSFLPLLPSGSVDAVVTDPPYGTEFGGMDWDGSNIRQLTGGRASMVSRPESFEHFTYLWAIEALRVLKPGGYLLSFGSTRTAHRLISGIEDVGFEIRDQLLWLYGNGVPKAGRDSQGRSSTLKPAYEPILLARKPAEGTLKANAKVHGTGLLEVDACRIADQTTGSKTTRWPANLTYSHTPDCDPRCCVPDCPQVLIDQAAPPVSKASRFFYATKASTKEREAGLNGLPRRRVEIMRHSTTPKPRANVHRTVKPVALMRWLTRLVTPPGGLVLDPFTGSGTTGIAAMLEERQFLGIEREPEYVRIARHRIEHWMRRGPEDAP